MTYVRLIEPQAAQAQYVWVRSSEQMLPSVKHFVATAQNSIWPIFSG